MCIHFLVKNIAIASDPHSPFQYHQGSYYVNPCYHAWHAFPSLSSLSPFFPHGYDLWLEWGIFLLFSWPFIYVSYWFQIHITNGLNFMHRKWYTGNQYMVKSAENRMRSNLELLPVINVKCRPRYISALKKSSPIYLGPIHFDTILMHWMSVKLADNFQIREHSWPCLFQSYIVLQYTPKSTQK
jgi:predicted DNA-binding protein (MmcQ/YjbR family)